MTIGFEVLHYQTIEDTIACVSSINNHVKEPVIVIVDNASPNGSGKKLAELYKNNNNIKVLLSGDNLGFAKGNNLGYEYLKSNYTCDFICCINNDTLLIEDDLEDKIADIYDKEQFGILAPKVILKDNSIQSFNPVLHDIEYYQRELKIWTENDSYSKYLKSKGIIIFLQAYFPRIMGVIRKKKQKITKAYDSSMKNVVLHGCFLIFSKKYIDKFDQAFNPCTFMYREEELLFIRTQKESLITLYSTDIIIKHMEDAATNSIYANKEAKYQFMRQNQINSLKILIEEIKAFGV